METKKPWAVPLAAHTRIGLGTLVLLTLLSRGATADTLSLVGSSGNFSDENNSAAAAAGDQTNLFLTASKFEQTARMLVTPNIGGNGEEKVQVSMLFGFRPEMIKYRFWDVAPGLDDVGGAADLTLAPSGDQFVCTFGATCTFTELDPTTGTVIGPGFYDSIPDPRIGANFVERHYKVTSPNQIFGINLQAGTGFGFQYDNLKNTTGAWNFSVAFNEENLSAAVPIPGAVWLLASACIGLIGLRRRHAA